VIRTTRRVDRVIDKLREHFERKRYLNAIRSLDAALVEAKRVIGENPTVGAPLLRPYPDPRLSRPGQLWFRSAAIGVGTRPRRP
jgi:hypothetical protein